MKKTLLAALFATMIGYVNAQTIETETSTNSTTTSLQTQQSSKLDSLEQQVAALQAKDAQRDKNDYDNAIWKRKKYFMFGYAGQNLETKTPEGIKNKYKSQVAFNLNWGRTYYLHKNAIADILKIGLDWSWINLSFAKYNSGSGIHINTDYSGYVNNGYQDDENEIELGTYQIETGMSIGPSFNIAPFYHVGKGLQHLKAHVYFHYTPSYSMFLESYDGENEFSSGFANFFNIGIDIAYKVISVGYEYRWGNAKYEISDFNEDNENYSSKTKTTMNTKTWSFFVRFNF